MLYDFVFLVCLTKTPQKNIYEVKVYIIALKCYVEILVNYSNMYIQCYSKMIKTIDLSK